MQYTGGFANMSRGKSGTHEDMIKACVCVCVCGGGLFCEYHAYWGHKDIDWREIMSTLRY